MLDTKRRRRRFAVLIALAAVGFPAVGGLGIALIWGALAYHETRSFDAAVARLSVGMARPQVEAVLGGPPGAAFTSQSQLELAQRKGREWYSDTRLPSLPFSTVLIFLANERELLVYLDARGRVTAAALGRKSDRRAFETLKLPPVGKQGQ